MGEVNSLPALRHQPDGTQAMPVGDQHRCSVAMGRCDWPRRLWWAGRPQRWSGIRAPIELVGGEQKWSGPRAPFLRSLAARPAGPSAMQNSSQRALFAGQHKRR